jgi:hypothetical protein
MPRAIRRIRVTKSALVPALAAALALSAGMASCITGPPPDPPQPPVLGPMIIQNGVMPSANQYLTALPDAFIVPVRAFTDLPVSCNVFVDYFDPGVKNNGTAVAQCGMVSPALEGGVTQLQFSLRTLDLATGPAGIFDPNACHTIQCFVGNSFLDSVSPHTPATSLGSDSVTWQYTPNGPGSCAQFDAGDGGFPPDSPSDTGVQLLLDVVNPPLL